MTLPVFAPGDRVEVVGVSQGPLVGATGTVTHVHPSNLVSLDTDQLPGIHLVSTRRLRHPHPRPTQHPAATTDAKKRAGEKPCMCGTSTPADTTGPLIHTAVLCTAPDGQEPGA